MEEPVDDTEYYYRKEILEALDNAADYPGSFACGGVLEKANLQLSVRGVGKIQLPLSFKQAGVLKTKCTAAPFGRGNETLVHKSLKDAWQLDANDVQLNKEFDECIKEKITEILPHLIGESVIEHPRQSLIENHKVELHKLVYYEKGGHFVANRDTDKKMFARLVIQLPAGHKGGALVINHNGYTEVFDYEDESQNKFFFTAFLAHCEKTLRRVSAGHRLVLIYNITQKSPFSTQYVKNYIKSSNNDVLLATVKEAVKKWNSDNNGPDYLVLKLDNLYSVTNMFFKNLQGKDKKVADILCSCKDIIVYLATLTKIDSVSYIQEFVGGCEYTHGLKLVLDEDSDRDISYTLNNWMGIDDTDEPFGEHRIGEDEMLNNLEDIFPDDDYEESEICRDSRVKKRQIYKKSAIVIFPKSYEVVLACKSNFNKVIDDCKNITEHKDVQKILKGILIYIGGNDSAMKQLKNNDNIASIFEILSVSENNLKLANNFLQLLIKSHNGIGLPTINSAVALANMIHKMRWGKIKAYVIQFVAKFVASQPLVFAQLVSSMVSLKIFGEAIKVVQVANPQILAQCDKIRNDYLALWLSLLASYDMFSSYLEEFVRKISNLRDDAIIEIMVEMHRSLQPKESSQNKIKECFNLLVQSLQDKGWESLSPESVTLLFPVLLFLDNNKILNSVAQAIIEHKNPCNILETICELPVGFEKINNPLIQILVRKRLQEPVFSWCQPKAAFVDMPPGSGIKKSEVQNFLRGDEQTKTFGGFHSMSDADSFGRIYFQNGNYNEARQYSAKHETSGSGKDAKCTIIKTRSTFDKQIEHYTMICREIKVLRKKYYEPNKTVLQKRALES